MSDHQPKVSPVPARRVEPTPTSSSASGGRRVLRLRLDAPRWAAIEQLAEDAGTSVEQLASIWLRERLNERAAAAALAKTADELGAIRAELARLIAVQRGGDSQSDATTRTASSRRSARERDGDSGGPRSSLHKEIVAVLQEHGGPLSAGEIAAAIRQRGQYAAPRSSQPISGATVSRRIANPYYRSLFERRGRRVGLTRKPAR
ncbi:MAG TPA: hypothetical protein VMP67_02990 [Candidatus Limnocylindria bacterium]|nr:hypothetical protein [Candidatus Limnocylindria bacterium]